MLAPRLRRPNLTKSVHRILVFEPLPVSAVVQAVVVLQSTVHQVSM